MAQTPSAQTVEESDDYYHVRFRDPDDYSDIRTPDWAEEPAGSVVEGSEVRTGKKEGSDDWEVQSVLIPRKGHDRDDAEKQANEILEKIES